MVNFFKRAFILFAILIIVFLAFGVQKTEATTWYNSSWLYRKTITVDHTKVSADQTNFPVLINLTSDSDLATNAQSSGNDILFTSSDGTTKLNHEIETYTSSTGALVAWVNVPALSSATDTALYLYYGNSGASDQSNKTAVWDSHYLGVWHGAETSGTTVSDSTAYGNDGTKTSATQPNPTTSGQVDGAQVYGGSDRVGTPITTALGDFTVEVWFKDNGVSDNGGFERLADKSYTKCFWFGRNSTTANSWGGGVQETSSPFGVFVTLTDGQWHQIVSERSGTTHYVWGDGGAVSNSNTVSNAACDSATFAIGAWGDLASTQQRFGGSIDEVRLSDIARSASWIATEYNNQSSPSTFYALGAQETGNSPPNAPTNSTPTNGALRQKITPTLTASAFSDPDGGDTQAAAQWLIRILSDPTYSSPAFDSGTDETNLTLISVPSGNLSKNTTYFWKVRYRDDLGEWSNYSSETAFTTGVVPVTVVSIGATEYTAGEIAKLAVQVTNADGSPVNDATVTLDIYNPSNTKVVNAGSMSYLTGSNGIYYYDYTIPSTIGVYIYDVNASYSGQNGYSSHTFHVAQFASDITSIKSTVESTSTDVDNLVGAFIVAQSTVNDAAAAAASFITSLTNATDDFYNNSVLTFTSGSLAGQVRRISNYVGATKIITVSPAFSAAPSNGDNFTIVKQNVYVEQQAENLQTDITYIKSKVDQIYSLLQTVDTNLSAVQTTVNNMRTSQQKAYTAKLSDVLEIQTGNTYRAKLFLLDYESQPVDADSTPIITIYDSTRAEMVSAADMTKLSTGIYEYTYSVASTANAGLWESVVTTAVGGFSNQNLNDYFQVIGSPAQVKINSMSDLTVPSVSANVTITNEGTGQFEYHYEWCVVDSSDNQCGGSDDTYYGSASKLIQAGDNLTTDLSAAVPNTGNYWFKVVVYYGTERSGASTTFTATTGSSSTITTTSSGGGMSQVVSLDVIFGELTAMKNTLATQSDRLSQALDILGVKTQGTKSLLEIGDEQVKDLKAVQNKLADLQAVSSTVRQIVESKSGNAVVETYMKFNSVEIIFLITNPADTRQTVRFKSYLSEEVKPENVLDLSGLKIDFDADANTYYVSGDIELGPKESVTKKVEIKDIWIFSEEEINSIKKQADDLANNLKNT